MNKKVIAVLAAAVLAVLGVVVLGAWAKQADARAYDGAKMVSVLQVTKQVPAATAAAELAGSTKVVELPDSAVADGALTSLKGLDGQVTTTVLEPGETLLRSRLADPDQKPAETTSVPSGRQELSISLETQRLVDAQLKVGDTVGVVGSYAEQAGYTTKLLANRVVITRFASEQAGGDASGQMIVTLALSAKQVESVANAAEFGKVWLTKQNADADTQPGDPVTPKENVR